MKILFFLATLPMLYWQQGIDSTEALRRAGIERMYVPPDQVDAWKKAGFSPVPLSLSELESRVKLPAPRISTEVQVASPTRSPWVVANGWRFLRNSSGKYYYDLPKGTAALAAAEAFAYGADAILKIDPADLEELGRMLAFLQQLGPSPAETLADLAVVDDGSPLTSEVMNLLARRNLLFRAVSKPDPQFRINIKLGTKQYPRAEAANPSNFALKIRRQITDEKRLLRVYGSEVVICRLTGDGSRVRLHLLNYGRGKIEGLRVRLRGAFAKGELKAAGYGNLSLEDYVVSDEATEFSIPEMRAYAVVDLQLK